MLTDKPLADSLGAALAIRDTAERTGGLVAITHTYRGYPMVVQARDLVASGDLGAVRRVAVRYTQGWLARAEDAVGKQAEWRVDPALGARGGVRRHRHACVQPRRVHHRRADDAALGRAARRRSRARARRRRRGDVPPLGWRTRDLGREPGLRGRRQCAGHLGVVRGGRAALGAGAAQPAARRAAPGPRGDMDPPGSTAATSRPMLWRRRGCPRDISRAISRPSPTSTAISLLRCAAIRRRGRAMRALPTGSRTCASSRRRTTAARRGPHGWSFEILPGTGRGTAAEGGGGEEMPRSESLATPPLHQPAAGLPPRFGEDQGRYAMKGPAIFWRNSWATGRRSTACRRWRNGRRTWAMSGSRCRRGTAG